MAESAQLKPRFISEEILSQAVMNRAKAQSAQKQQEAPEGNAFYKIMMSNASPEEKKQAVAKALTFTNKEEAKAAMQSYQQFEEYAESVREKMAEEIIHLTDTEAFSELKQVYSDLNDRLIDFDKKMKPLTDITDAIYVLRTNDKTLEAFQEIQEDKKAEDQRKAELEQKGKEFRSLKGDIQYCNESIARLGEERTFFGFGGVTERARKEIASKQLAVQQAKSKLDTLAKELGELEKKEPNESNLGEFAEQKAKLRELLDISTDEHKQRQKDLVSAALDFCSTAKTRIGSVKEHYGQMDQQIERLYDSTTRLNSVFTVLSEGAKDATLTNQNLRKELMPPDHEESTLEKMDRENHLTEVNEHLQNLDTVVSSTKMTYADLISQTIRVKTMKDANRSQMEEARVLHTQGIAGVADRLSVILQAVSAAALGEASAMTKDTLLAMKKSTDTVAKKETIRIAMGVDEMNKDILKAIEDLGSYGEIRRVATDITYKGLTEAQALLAQIEELSKGVQGDIRDSIAVHADVGAGAPSQTSSDQPKPNGQGLF